jgi:hypothetical protein
MLIETITISATPVAGAFSGTVNLPWTPKKCIIKNFSLSITGQTVAVTERLLMLRSDTLLPKNNILMHFPLNVSYAITGAADDTIDLSFSGFPDTEFLCTNSIQGNQSFRLTLISGAAPNITWTNSAVAITLEFHSE